MSNCPIAVTGLGCMSPLGASPELAFAAHVKGCSAAALLQDSWAENLRSRLACKVDFDAVLELGEFLANRLDRYAQLALLASRQAWAASGLKDCSLEPERLAVVMATGIGGMVTMLGQYERAIVAGKRGHPLGIAMAMPNAAAAQIAIEIGACGGSHAPVSACASGAEAVAWAQMLLAAGRVDVVLVGGAEAAIHPLTLKGFSEMRALATGLDKPTSACRPFASDRDGFVLGEGAGALVLERADQAKARGAEVHGLLLGAAMTSDAHHLAMPHPEAQHAAQAISRAIRYAGLTPLDIHFISAHATGTKIGDLAESRAIQSVFGAAIDQLWVTAPKGSLGHLLGGAGAVESILTLKALQTGVVPLSLNSQPRDPEIPLNIPASSEQCLPMQRQRFAIKNTFGFGGHNVSLVWASA
jgi:3-oxoacyl-[acyl-carrier-protein] synthase II